MTASLFRTILVPHDFSPDATLALRTAIDLARAARGRLVVLHAVPPYYAAVPLPPLAPAEAIPSPLSADELIASERRRLETVVARELRARGAPAAECRVVIGDPFQAIVDAAHDATAIVMGTLGRTGLSHLLLGSVAEKVVRHAPIPVLTVRTARSARRHSKAA